MLPFFPIATLSIIGYHSNQIVIFQNFDKYQYFAKTKTGTLQESDHLYISRYGESTGHVAFGVKGQHPGVKVGQRSISTTF